MPGVNITAFVVAHNESHLLPACLKSVSFCNEIILIDLESSDNITEVASSFNVKLFPHPRVAVVEELYCDIAFYATNEWVLIIDPDEEITESLQNDIIKAIDFVHERTGTISVPWQFYFKEKQLKGATWGGISKKTLLVNTNRYLFTGEVHEKGKLKEGYSNFDIKFNGKNYIRHYWMKSYRQLAEKHKRYILKEGERMFNNGTRYSNYKLLKNSANAFRYSYFIKKGYIDGLKGFNLSVFWMWYVFNCWRSLAKYKHSQKQVD